MPRPTRRRGARVRGLHGAAGNRDQIAVATRGAHLAVGYEAALDHVAYVRGYGQAPKLGGGVGLYAGQEVIHALGGAPDDVLPTGGRHCAIILAPIYGHADTCHASKIMRNGLPFFCSSRWLTVIWHSRGGARSVLSKPHFIC